MMQYDKSGTGKKFMGNTNDELKNTSLVQVTKFKNYQVDSKMSV